MNAKQALFATAVLLVARAATHAGIPVGRFVDAKPVKPAGAYHDCCGPVSPDGLVLAFATVEMEMIQ